MPGEAVRRRGGPLRQVAAYLAPGTSDPQLVEEVGGSHPHHEADDDAHRAHRHHRGVEQRAVLDQAPAHTGAFLHEGVGAADRLPRIGLDLQDLPARLTGVRVLQAREQHDGLDRVGHRALVGARAMGPRRDGPGQGLSVEGALGLDRQALAPERLVELADGDARPDQGVGTIRATSDERRVPLRPVEQDVVEPLDVQHHRRTVIEAPVDVPSSSDASQPR